MRRVVHTLLVLLAITPLAALLLAWSGLYNVGASKPHWAITRWFLHFALRESVETHAMGIDAPDLSRPSLIYAGLGHYEAGCAVCHGKPGEPHKPIARAMRPEPPYLPKAVAKWTPPQLFWIVKHGFKYTGMPAWPAQQRDDEVWAVVAALVALPGMTPDEYRRATRGDTLYDPARVEETARLIVASGPVGENLASCGRCHGMRGAGGGAGAFPRLAGQSEAYLYHTLKAYAAGQRASGLMEPVAAELTDSQMMALAAYYAGLDDVPLLAGPVAETLIPRGRRIAAGIGGLPACAACHGPAEPPRNPMYPRLSGQFAEYLAGQLRLFTEGKRGGILGEIMRTVAQAHALTEEDIQAVAAYYAAMGPQDE